MAGPAQAKLSVSVDHLPPPTRFSQAGVPPLSPGRSGIIQRAAASTPQEADPITQAAALVGECTGAGQNFKCNFFASDFQAKLAAKGIAYRGMVAYVADAPSPKITFQGIGEVGQKVHYYTIVKGGVIFDNNNSGGIPTATFMAALQTTAGTLRHAPFDASTNPTDDTSYVIKSCEKKRLLAEQRAAAKLLANVAADSGDGKEKEEEGKKGEAGKGSGPP